MVFNPVFYMFQSRVDKTSTVYKFILAFVFLVEIVHIYRVNRSIFESIGNNEEIIALTRSKFIMIMYGVYVIYRFMMIMAMIVVVVMQQKSISSIISSKSYLLTDKRQAQLARNSFYINLFRSTLKSSFVMPVYWPRLGDLVSVMLVVAVMDLALTTPSMYIFYLGSSLTEHVKNFSESNVDSMFHRLSQPVAEVEAKAGFKGRRNSLASTLATSSMEVVSWVRWTNYRELREALNPYHIRKLAGNLVCGFRYFRSRFTSRSYLEMPDMKVASAEDRMKVLSDACRRANQSLIKIRLKRVQLMLCELRDTVDGINKLSSLITFIEILDDAFIVVLVSTGSIQLKFYRSFNVITWVNIGAVANLLVHVYFTCTCLDDPVAELQLMINKLFDFIIINRRLDESSSASSALAEPSLLAHEDSEVTEIWSQFQYARQLADTIRFSWGGLTTVSRRLVLRILAHVLSTVFLAIEAMNIVDTRMSTTKVH